MSLQVDVRGLIAIDKRLQMFGKDAGKVLRTSAKLAITPVQKAIKQKSPKRTGNLRKSFKPAVLKRSKKTGRYGYRVTAARPEGSHAHLIEYGFHPRGGETFVEPNNFVEEAWRAKQSVAERVYVRAIRQGVTKLSSDAAKTIKADVRRGVFDD